MYNSQKEKERRLKHNKKIIEKFNSLEPEEIEDEEMYASIKTEIDEYTAKHIPNII